MFSQSKLYHFTNCALVSADMLLFFSLVCIHLCTCFMRKEIVSVLCTPGLKTHYGNNTRTEKYMFCENGDKKSLPFTLIYQN